MGHRIQTQARGKGGPSYRAPSHQYRAAVHHAGSNDTLTTGTILAFEHDPARNGPVALIGLADGRKTYTLAIEGTGVGETLSWGKGAAVKNGNTLPLVEIPVGIMVCNLENRPNDGGKMVRSGGVQALVMGKSEENRVGVRMPSGKLKWFHGNCMATIGIVAGGGRGEKPFVKAGKKFHKMKSSASKWPIVRGVAMNVIDHPFGGGGHQHAGRPKTVARGTSPGRKVGLIAARRTGRKKK